MLSTGTLPDRTPVSASKAPATLSKPARNVAIAWWVMLKRTLEWIGSTVQMPVVGSAAGSVADMLAP